MECETPGTSLYSPSKHRRIFVIGGGLEKKLRVFTTEGKYFGLKRLEVIGSYLVIETLKYIQTVVK